MKEINFAIGILAHDNFEGIQELINYYIAEKVPVVVHVDKKSKKLFCQLNNVYGYDDGRLIKVISIRDCRWGEWSLVQAELDIYKEIIQNINGVNHVHFMSGSDVPIKSVRDLSQHLAMKPNHDFIEIVDIERDRFMVTGYQLERLIYRYPFNYLCHKRMFDLFLKIQKIIRLKKSLPNGFEARMGGQFKTLRLSTIKIIFDLLEKQPNIQQFFMTAWIPDESFFPTVINHLYSTKKVVGEISDNLTYRVFDKRGRPTVIYPDHLNLLSTGKHFFARKFDRFSKMDLTFLDESRNIDNETKNDFQITIPQSNVHIIVWDYSLTKDIIEKIVQTSGTPKVFLGSLEEKYDSSQDQLINWNSLNISKEDLLIWRKFRYIAILSFIKEVSKLPGPRSILSVNVESISRYNWWSILKELHVSITFLSKNTGDFRFTRIMQEATKYNIQITSL